MTGSSEMKLDGQAGVLSEKHSALSERLDAVIDAIDEILLFGNDRLHRVSPPQATDTVRLTKLHNKLRALRSAVE